MTEKAIGIFDSGVGGMSVLKKIIHLLPDESLTYLADSANCPYGSKSSQEIVALLRRNIDFLIKQQCKLIVIACNTATAAAIEILRNEYPVPFVGMEPAVKPAAENSRNGKIGVLATEGTFNGRLYKSTKRKHARNIEVDYQVGNGLVELVESGNCHSKEADELLKIYIEPMIKNGVDQIVLGCTHYPFLIDTIRKIAGNKIQIIDPSGAVANQVKKILTEKRSTLAGAHTPVYQFYTTGKKSIAVKLLKKITDKHFICSEITHFN